MRDRSLWLLVPLAAATIGFAVFAPPSAFESVMLDVVGMEPTGFFDEAGGFHLLPGPDRRPLTWADGHSHSGREAIRVMAVLGALIFFVALFRITRLPDQPLSRETPPRRWEVPAFLVFSTAFVAFSVSLGTSWWDIEHPLYFGRTFPLLIAANLFLGVWPLLAIRIGRLRPRGDLVPARRNVGLAIAVSLAVTVGYGLYSTLWHCCKMWLFADVSYFVAVKIAVLYPMLFFVYGYGYPLFERTWGKRAAVAVCAVLTGALTPWHTLGFAVSYAVFGVALWFLMRKTGTHLTPFLVMYLAYIAHALMPWQGDAVTWYLIVPGGALLLIAVALAPLPAPAKSEVGSLSS
jgi:hypothetical protein